MPEADPPPAESPVPPTSLRSPLRSETTAWHASLLKRRAEAATPEPVGQRRAAHPIRIGGPPHFGWQAITGTGTLQTVSFGPIGLCETSSAPSLSCEALVATRAATLVPDLHSLCSGMNFRLLLLHHLAISPLDMPPLLPGGVFTPFRVRSRAECRPARSEHTSQKSQDVEPLEAVGRRPL